jgi:urease accessory protein
MSLIELLLADGRFPGGGFAHSGGLEAAVAEGDVRTLTDVESFAAGRLTTTGMLDAWVAARACQMVRLGPAGLSDPAVGALQDEAEAHQPSPALRAASRAQGRGLRRAAAVIWPQLEDCPHEVHAVVLGVVAAVAGLDPVQAARLAVHGVLMSTCSAAPKLLPLDMADALSIEVRLASLAEAVVTAAVDPNCPMRGAPAVELRAERHAHWEVRLFAS